MNITIDDFQNLVSDNGDPEMAFNIGEISEKHNDFESAIIHYSKALMYDNTYSKAYFNRAKCFTRLKQYEKAIVDFKNYLQFILETDKISFSNIYLEIGQLQGEKGDFKSALNSFIKSVEYNPNNLIALELRGTMYSHLGNIENAISDYLELKKLDIDFFNNSPNLLLNLPILDKGMALEDKINFTERGVKLNPTYEIGYFNLGFYYKKANLIDKSIDAFEKAHQLAPKSLDNLNELCQCLADKKDYNKLKVYLEKLAGLGDIKAKGNLDNLNEYFELTNKALIEEDSKSSYKLMPVMSSSFEMTEYGIDVIDKENFQKISLRIYESYEFEYGSPEYDYWVERIGDEGEMPQIHVWVVSKYEIYETDNNQFEESDNSYSSFEFYRGESIYYPSKEYDNMFERMVNENLGKLATYTIIEFLDVLESK